MADLRLHSSTSNLIRFRLVHSTTGQGLTGLTEASSGLIISTICDNEATATTYTAGGSTIETISTLGTFATPTTNKCRFKEVDATNHKGLYEFQFANARFSVASARRLVIGVTGATNLLDAAYEIQLVSFDPYDAVRLGLTALPNAAAEASGGLYTRGTGAGQINQAANGMIDTNPVRLNNVSQSLLDLKDFADDGYDPSTNKVQGVVLTDTVTTYTGNTPQTGDAFARLGAPAGASVSADILAIDNFVDDLESRIGTPSDLGSGATIAANLVDIEAQTDDIGTAGAGLSNVPWNASWDTEVQSEVQDAIEVNNLDHLVKIAVDTDFPTTVHLNSVVGHLADNGSSATFDRTTDSQEALRDNVGTNGAALSLAKTTNITGFNDLSAAQVNTEVDTALADVNLDHLVGTATGIPAIPAGTYMDQIMDDGTAAYDRTTDSLQAVRDRGDAAWATSTLTASDVWAAATRVLTAGTNIVLAKGVGVTGFNDLSAAQVNAEADTALSDVGLTTTVTGRVDAAISTRATPAQVNAEVVDVVSVDVIADSVAADGSRPTINQALLMIARFLMEKSVSGTTVTVKKEDGSTSSMTLTLDNGTTPTSITRSG